MAETKKKDPITIEKTTSKIGNVMMVVVCTALVLPVFFTNLHSGYPYLLICGGIEILSALFVLWNIKKSRPAIKLLPLLAFNDILIYAVLLAANLISKHKITGVSSFIRLFPVFQNINETSFRTITIITAIVFFIALIVSAKHSDIFFSVLFSIEGIVLLLFYVWRQSNKLAYGRIVLSTTLIVMLIWIFVCIYSSASTRGAKRNTSFFSIIITIISLAFNSYMATASVKGLNDFFVIPAKITDEVAKKMYPWWLAILYTVAFIVCGTVLGFFADDKGEDKIVGYVDAKFFYGIAAISLLSKIILSNYFSYSIVLYFILIFYICSELTKDRNQISERKENKGLYSASDLYISGAKLIYFTICAVFIVQLTENLLYITLPVAIIIMGMFYKLLKNAFKEWILEEEIDSVLKDLPKSYFETVLVLSILLTASLVYHYRFSVGNFIILGVELLTILLVYAALKRKLPQGIKLPEIKTVKWCITVFAITVCIVLTASSGAKVKSDYNDTKQTATISIETNKKASVKQIEYKWNNGIIYDGYQMLMIEEDPIGNEKQSKKIKGLKSEVDIELPVEGECLTIWVTDSNGVKTTRTLWYPLWFDAEGKK